jgi:hypothetical protein
MDSIKFGPFLIPADYLIDLSGFDCPLCKSQVREIRKELPASPWTFVFKTCSCEKTIIHFVGDPGPGNAKSWKRCIKLATKRGVDVITLNLNPSDETSFGRN